MDPPFITVKFDTCAKFPQMKERPKAAFPLQQYHHALLLPHKVGTIDPLKAKQVQIAQIAAIYILKVSSTVSSRLYRGNMHPVYPCLLEHCRKSIIIREKKIHQEYAAVDS